MHNFDVIIVGSGPASASTALHLTRADPAWAGRILILEKAAHPRHKLCGGGITRFGLDMLDRMGLEIPVPVARVETARIVFENRVFVVKSQPVFVVSRRDELDAWLANCVRERGVALHENEAMLDLHVGPEHVTVTTAKASYRARVLVAADGSKGTARRKLGMARGPSRISRLLEILTPADDTRDPEFTHRSAIFEFSDALDGLQGYYWNFPTYVDGKPVLTRGIYDSRVYRAGPRVALKPLLASQLARRGLNLADFQLEGHPLHTFSPRGMFSRPRVLLAGDTAGADPLFGEGIGMALAYGKLAAAEILAAFESGQFDFAGYRWRILKSHLGWYLTARWLLAHLIYRLTRYRWFMRFMWTIGYWLGRLLQRLRLL